MGSNHKSVVLGTGIAIAFAFGATVANAGSITDTYATGDTLTATKMNNIKSAVNDNDTRTTTNTNNITTNTTAIGTLNTTVGGHTTSITTLTTDVNNLKNNVPGTTCSAGMTRVGPTCVETARRAAATWNAAVNTCRTNSMRLLTPGEYVAAKNQAGAALGMNTNNEFEWVDAVSSNGTADATIPGAAAGRLMVGYMGPATAAVIGSGTDGDLFFGLNADYDVDYGIFYRCAR